MKPSGIGVIWGARSPMPEIRSLEVFYWVAQLNSFRRAAERLNTTQPAVSQRVAALETELGLRLFDRAARSVSLTPKGRELLDYAERMLRLRADMMRAVAAPAALSGLMRLGVSETIVHTWLAKFIERVNSTFPGITLDIVVDVSPNLRDALVVHELDMAFLLGPVSQPNMTNYDLCRYPLAFVVRSDIDLGPEPVPLARLTEMPIITFPKTTRPYLTLRDTLSRAELPAPRIFSNSSLSTIVRMTEDGIGISVIPPVVIPRELATGALRIVRTDVKLPDLAFTASLPLTPDGLIADPVAQLAREIAQA
ncbi:MULTISPECIES: LysR family transcriptional regulator [Rhodomicrobium]|uniref:LysR family transcriptional regulator n=1 Tax=Rhodomicrobium TaxID=1068 RepID=UPI001FD93501|nr:MULTISPECIES: LysR family transcriptional regulator [Rhodomicrobium]